MRRAERMWRFETYLCETFYAARALTEMHNNKSFSASYSASPKVCDNKWGRAGKL